MHKNNFLAESQRSLGTLGISKIALSAIIIVLIAIGGVTVVYIERFSSSSSSCNDSSTTTSSIVRIAITSGAASSSGAPGYSPDNATLVIGQNSTVVWMNNDSAGHTVTTSNAPSGTSFDSGRISGGSCYTHTFTTPGTYEYFCTYHSWMRGTIVVQA